MSLPEPLQTIQTNIHAMINQTGQQAYQVLQSIPIIGQLIPPPIKLSETSIVPFLPGLSYPPVKTYDPHPEGQETVVA